MNEKRKRYTAADLIRYHTGTMPPAEMHALEKAALEDPFLADAVEGYTHPIAMGSSPAENDIQELKSRLAEKRKKKNVFFLYQLAEKGWWRIAALFFIITATAYLFYTFDKTNKEIALKKDETKTSTATYDTVLMNIDTESTSGIFSEKDLEAAFEQQSSAKPLPLKKDEEGFVSTEKPESARLPTSASKAEGDFYADSTNTEDEKKEPDSSAATRYVLRGNVTDQDGYPVSSASIKETGTRNGTATDAEGNFVLTSKDSSVEVIATGPGLEPKTFSIEKNMPATIAVNRSRDQANEVAVTALGIERSKKPATKSKSLNEKVAGIESKAAIPIPPHDQIIFQQYVRKNIRPLYNENNERLTGQVSLSFTIDTKGRPSNIKVLGSSCQICEKEAVRLLQDGPAWAGKKTHRLK